MNTPIPPVPEPLGHRGPHEPLDRLDDAALLKAYVQQRSQSAFAALVQRHIHFVYSIALRQVSDHHLAEDVTQAVFIILAQKGSTMTLKTSLAPWLFRVTGYACADALRSSARRRFHERVAQERSASSVTSPSEPDRWEWDQLAPLLDGAIATLSQPDQRAVILRFYAQCNWREVGAELGVSEEAAQMRLKRALEKLRSILMRRGVNIAGAGLATLIAAHAVQAAPTGLAASTTSVAGAAIQATTATSAAAAIAKGATATMTWVKVKLAAMIVGAAVLTGGAGVVVIQQTLAASTQSPAVAPKPAGMAVSGAPVRPSRPPAPAPATKPEAELRKQHTVITGVVVDEKGQGMPDVTVEVLGMPSGLAVAAKTVTTTGPDGRFSLAVRDIEYNAWTNLLRAHGPDSQQGFIDRTVDGQLLDDVKITLKAAREFPVTVKDDQGTPIVGAVVAAAMFHAILSDAYRTDDKGQALLRMPADAPLHYVFAFKDGAGLDYFAFWHPQQVQEDPYHLAPDFAGPLPFTLNGAQSVTVRVEDETHQKLADADVAAWYFAKPRKGEAFDLPGAYLFHHPALDGSATFAMIPADNLHPMTFWVRKEGYTSTQRWTWDPKSGKNEITATLVKMVHLSGLVLGADGRPARGATVMVGGEGYSIGGFDGQTETQEDGTFAIDVDPEQYYVLSALKDHDVASPITQLIHKQAPADPITLQLMPGLRIHGKATAGPENVPAANAYVALSYDDESYNELPPEQRFPRGAGRQAISPSPNLIQRGQTDKQGEFEFYSFFGSFTLIGSFGSSQSSQPITLQNEKKEVAIHFERATREPAPLHGRVVLADKPEVGVGEAAIKGQTTNGSPAREEGVADRQGNFQIRQASTELVVYVVSPDKKFGGVATIKPGEDNVTLRLAPAASAKGRLVDKNGKALAKQAIVISVAMELPGRIRLTSNRILDMTTTAADGTFAAEGLIPGQTYNLSVRRPGDDENSVPPKSESLDVVKPESAETIDLGDRSVPD